MTSLLLTSNREKSSQKGSSLLKIFWGVIDLTGVATEDHPYNLSSRCVFAEDVEECCGGG